MSKEFNLEDYKTVEERIKEFWTHYPHGRITTSLVELDNSDTTARMVVIKAKIYKQKGDEHPTSTGYAKEREGTRGANQTSFIENCETSAIGRGLANLGIGVDRKRPSREEMEAVTATNTAHEANLTLLKDYAQGLPDENPVKAKLRDEWRILEHSPLEVYKLVVSLNLNPEPEVEEVVTT